MLKLQNEFRSVYLSRRIVDKKKNKAGELWEDISEKSSIT